jgi:hypothetical protein
MYSDGSLFDDVNILRNIPGYKDSDSILTYAPAEGGFKLRFYNDIDSLPEGISIITDKNIDSFYEYYFRSSPEASPDASPQSSKSPSGSKQVLNPVSQLGSSKPKVSSGVQNLDLLSSSQSQSQSSNSSNYAKPLPDLKNTNTPSSPSDRLVNPSGLLNRLVNPDQPVSPVAAADPFGLKHGSSTLESSSSITSSAAPETVTRRSIFPSMRG